MTARTVKTWQEELDGECKRRQLTAPIYNILSDRRGGRTAWSAAVTVYGQRLAARYWYDGAYVNNAKEDASEVACTWLRGPPVRAAMATFGAADREGAAAEEEKKESEEEEMPEGAIARVGEDILD